MKVLAAAPYSFAGVEIGFCDCEPGELVRLGDTDECVCHRYDDEDEFDDDVCECHLDREESPPFLGLGSLAGTTTARVEERNLSDKGLRDAVRASLQGEGWLPPGLPDGVACFLVDTEVARIHHATSGYSVGTLISSLNGITFPVGEATARAVPHRRHR